MARINEMASLHICAIWLVKARRRDRESIKFWSQVLNCEESMLSRLMLQVEKLENPCRDKPVVNALLVNIHDQINEFTVPECKHLLDSSRKFEEAKDEKEIEKF